MAFNNVRIQCQPVLWQTPDVKQVSIFSGAPRIYMPSVIDLKDFITEDSNEEINYEFELIKEGNISDTYFHKAGDFSITVTDLKSYGSDKTLYNFFQIFHQNPFMRFVVTVYYDDTVIFNGMIFPDGITYEDPESNSSVDSDSKLIHLDVISLEKDFAEYFKNMQLPDDASYNAWEYLFTFTQTESISENIYGRGIKQLLSYLFNNIPISMPWQIAEWKIARDATFRYSPATSITEKGLYFPPVGYKQIQREGTSRYDFLEKLCNGMGWVFRIKDINGALGLEINDRSFMSSSIPVKNYTADDIIGISSIYCEGIENQHRYIRITPHIELTGGDAAFHNHKNLKSAHDIIIGSDDIKNFNGYHFDDIGVIGFSYDLKVTNNPANQLKVTKLIYQDDFEAKYVSAEYYPSYSETLSHIPKREFLHIDCGRNSVQKKYVDLGLRSVGFYDGTQDLNDNHLVFSGCFASSLFKFQYIPMNFVKYSYSNIDKNKSYIHSELFKKNMQAILNSYTKNYVEISFRGVSLDPLHLVQLTGCVNQDLNKRYVVLSMKINIFQDTTTYKLIEKEEVTVV